MIGAKRIDDYAEDTLKSNIIGEIKMEYKIPERVMTCILGVCEISTTNCRTCRDRKLCKELCKKPPKAGDTIKIFA